MEEGHSFHIDSGEVEVRTWQVDQVVQCGSDVRGVAVVVVAGR
jgi:hypothetical protein